MREPGCSRIRRNDGQFRACQRPSLAEPRNLVFADEGNPRLKLPGKCSQRPKVPLLIVEGILQSRITPTNFPRIGRRERIVKHLFAKLWWQNEGQDVAEYSVMLAVILVVIVGTIHLIGGNSNNIFSAVASSIVQ